MIKTAQLRTLGLALSFSLMVVGCTPNNGETSYQTVDLTEIQGDLTGDDPKAITLNLFGTKEPIEGNFSEEITVLKEDGFKQTLILTQLNLPDDSVKGMRYRLNYEFDQSMGKWRLVEVGRQFSCYRREDPTEWTTDLCP